MDIETKHIFALIVLAGFGAAGLFGTLISQRVREFALFALVFGAVLVERMNVTFLGHFWYRGTSRGIEIAAIDIVPACLLLSNLILPRGDRRPFLWPASLGIMLLYAAYCAASVAMSDPQIYGVWELAKIIRGLLVFVCAAWFIRTRRELGIVVLALVATACLEGVSALVQRHFQGALRVAGTFDHENTLSSYLCLIAPVLLAAALSDWSRWLRGLAGVGWLMAAGAEVFTLSRMGVPVFAFVSAATAVACSSWQLTRRKVVVSALAAAVVGAFLAISWEGLKSRYTQSNIRAEITDAKGFETRGVYWRLALQMSSEHPFGVGLNNWSYVVGKTYRTTLGYPYADYDDLKWVPTKDDYRQALLPPAADTLPALTLGELGIAGFAIFLVLWLRWLQLGVAFLRDRLNEDPMLRVGIGFLFGVLGLFLHSATEWTYRQTPVFFTCHVLMGALASLYYLRKHALVSSGAPVPSAEEPVVDAIPVSAVRAAK